MSPQRRIAHLDMDAFFASVELLRYPQLRGQAVVVGGRIQHAPKLINGELQFARLGEYVGRGVATTSTYEARALGVFSAMGLMKAAQLAPQAYLLPADFNAYRHYSRLFKAAVASITPLIENRGIDEIYIDLTHLPEETLPLAQRIKQAVFDATGLTCSIGISPNKLLSKICSEFDKPNGLTILTEADIQTRIWPLAVSKVNGIGPKAARKLTALGIETIAHLAEADLGLLQEHFGGNYAMWLHDVAYGRDDRAVVTHAEPKSISRETTFERDLHARHDRAKLSEIFTRLCEQLADDLQRKGYRSKTIGIKLKFDDFSIATREISLPQATADAQTIRHIAGQCLKRVTLDKKLRLLGVRAGSLFAEGEEPATVKSELQFSFDF